MQRGRFAASTPAMSERGCGVGMRLQVERDQSLHECKHLKLYEATKLLFASGEEFAQEPFRLLLVSPVAK